MASVTFKKIVQDLSSKDSVKNLIQDFKKLSAELKTKAHTLDINLHDSKAVHQAKAKYREIINTLNNSQAKIDTEVNKALDLIRTSATEVEKNILTYKKAALAQKEKLEKMIKTGRSNKSSRAKSSASNTMRAKKATSTKKAKARTSTKKSARPRLDT